MSFFPQNVSISLFRKSEIGVSCGRTGPAGLRGLRKQVTEVKDGPLELGRKQARMYMPGGEKRGKGWDVLEREGEGDTERERERECHPKCLLCYVWSKLIFSLSVTPTVKSFLLFFSLQENLSSFF